MKADGKGGGGVEKAARLLAQWLKLSLVQCLQKRGMISVNNRKGEILTADDQE